MKFVREQISKPWKGATMIEVKSLTKTYSNGKGIFDLSFEVKKGEVFGYLGPNGAGKTTTIRHLLGFINADIGSCQINGLDCRTRADMIQHDLGYLPGEIAFFNEMTGVSFLKFMSDLRGKVNTKRRDELIERFELESDRKIGKMSKGMKQKVGIITAFMHDPKVLILDEPTSGLDPLMQNRFIELIQEEKARGKTILMSSHHFDEVDRTCDRVGMINEGRLITVEDIHHLKANQRKAFVVSFNDQEGLMTLIQSGLEVEPISETSAKVIISNNYDELIKVLSMTKVNGLDVRNQSLEQVFMQYYGKGRA
jgi:ABC-2 type transport system ATP-binding protein